MTWPATATRVADGDTLTLDVHLDWTVHVIATCRLNGIDAPERGTAAGRDATRYLTQLVTGPLTVSHEGRDRYGRWLVTISTPTCPSVADALVAAGHARRWT